MTASEHLLAGFAEIDISPPLGTQIAGDIDRPRPTEEIREPIFVPAAVLENEGAKLGVLVLDLLGIGRERADRIRDGGAERFGFDRRAVMVHTTQTHSAPSLGNHFCADDNPIIPPEHAWLRGSTPEYTPTAVDKEGKSRMVCAGMMQRFCNDSVAS